MAKTTKQKEVKTVTDAKERIMTLKQELSRLRLDLAAGKLKDTSDLRKKRKEVARLLTARSAQKYEKSIEG